MICPACGRYAPPDPETGYDADDICPTCARDGWTIDARGDVVRELDRPEVRNFAMPPGDDPCPF